MTKASDKEGSFHHHPLLDGGEMGRGSHHKNAIVAWPADYWIRSQEQITTSIPGTGLIGDLSLHQQQEGSQHPHPDEEKTQQQTHRQTETDIRTDRWKSQHHSVNSSIIMLQSVSLWQIFNLYYCNKTQVLSNLPLLCLQKINEQFDRIFGIALDSFQFHEQ